MSPLRDMFKGVGGGFDTARILYFGSGIATIVAPVVFQAWALWKGQSWDPIAFCTGYGGALTAVVLGGAAGIRQKDKGVADAATQLGLPPQSDTTTAT